MDDNPNEAGGGALDLIQDALNANKKLQITLNKQAEKLDAELQRLDRLLAAASVDDADEDPQGEISIPGSKRAAGLFPSFEFLNAESPFFSEARKRTDYFANITPRPMKDKDLEALTDAVKKENARLKAYEDASMSGGNETVDLAGNLEGLDWTRIAERVSDTSSITRNATECRIAWIANKRPTVNHTTWSNKELNQLSRLVTECQQQNKPVNWVDIAERLGTNRIPIDCMRHGITRPRHAWTPPSDQALIEAVELYGLDNWHLVAGRVSEHVTPSQCQTRWTKSVDPTIKRRAWTVDEDHRLRKAVEGYGQSWIQVATVVPGRTNDQCRERWTEHLNLGDQNVWTEPEDKVLKDSVQELGNKWKDISKRLNGLKTGQACRARYDKLKRADKRQESQRGLVESLTSAPPAMHPPTTGHNILPPTPVAPNVVPSPTTSHQAPQSVLSVLPRQIPRVTAEFTETINGPGTISSELVPGSAPAGSLIKLHSPAVPQVSASLQRSELSPQKKGRKRKAIEDNIPATSPSSSDAPKRTRVTRSQTQAAKSS